jgi:hypothetical protein
MAIATRIVEWDYILQEDRGRPVTEQVVFRLCPLRWAAHQENARVEVTREPDGGITVATDRYAVMERTLNAGLVGWSNMHDATGAVIEFRREDKGGKKVIPEALLTVIEPWANELATAIDLRSGMTPEEQKN